MLAGFSHKDQIPTNATKEPFDDFIFDHQFSDITDDGWDECNFWGNIYLPLNEEIYMKFEVHG